VENGRRVATPLFVTLLVIETTDVVFAVDSIPAVLGITKEPFIAFTSNVFAIIGLRSLYFALNGMMSKFRFLSVGLAVLLVFIGLKMLVESWGWYDVSIAVSLGVIGGVLAVTVGASLLFPGREQGRG
jgi:tellurite resistance protein TerC